jgi:3-hydroxyisobutyrate dehydrogenase-like beta-hydroxyacid dehydrogenase
VTRPAARAGRGRPGAARRPLPADDIKAIIERDSEPSFKLVLAAKDASLIEESARRRHLELALVDKSERLAHGPTKHPLDDDMIATYLTSARMTGSHSDGTRAHT